MSKYWPLSEQFRIRLTMESDWHVGSGMGRPGNIDRLIARDADDLPFVPAKTLRGIWRDACERLCRGLDDGQLVDWSRLVDRLFGSQPALGPNDPTGRHGNPVEVPLESAVQIRSALIPSPLGGNWWNRLNGEVSLGRSRKDDYGSVRLDAEPAMEWKPSTRNTETDLIVWLVSDTLLRNSRLRAEPTAACLGEELSRRLGVTLKLRESTDGQLDELVRIRRLDTWHVGWGLPRPSLIALQAGSCMVFQAEGSIDPTKLAQLEASGIGERTAEGYGQVRFNHPLLTEPLVRQADSGRPAGSEPGTTRTMTIASSDPAFAFARLIERECWKQEIRRACLAFANSAQNRKNTLGWVARGEQGQPPMSQLGGLRGQLAMLRTVQDRPQVIGWLDHLAGNNRRRDKWPSIPEVRAFIESDSRIWDIVKTDSWPTLTTNAQSELKRELWTLAVRTFFDACIRAHKRELEVASGA